MLLSAVGCGSSGSSPSPTTYVSVEYGISFAIPAGFSPSKIDVSPSLGSLRQIGEWRNPDTKTQMGLFVMNTSKEQDPRDRVVPFIQSFVANVLAKSGTSVKRAFSWADDHPVYLFSEAQAANPASGQIVVAAIAGKPYSYTVMLRRDEADSGNLTGATAESLLASMKFSGSEAQWRVDPTGYRTYIDRSNGYSLTYPDRFVLDLGAPSGAALAIIDAASASSFAPALRDQSGLVLYTQKNPHRVTQSRAERSVQALIESGRSRAVMGSIVSSVLTTGGKLLSVSQPQVLLGYGTPGMSAVVTYRTASNKTERVRARAFLLVTPTHLLSGWLSLGGDVQSLVRIVRSIRAVD